MDLGVNNLKDIAKWFIEVNELKERVEKMYLAYLPIRYNTDEYRELCIIWSNAYKELKNAVKNRS